MMKPQASNAPDRLALDGRLSFTAAAAPTADSAAWFAAPEPGALTAPVAAPRGRARWSFPTFR